MPIVGSTSHNLLYRRYKMTKTLTLRSLDIPSIHKLGIGFDSLLDDILRINSQQSQSNYPPYNVIKHSDDKFSIELAVAGFNDGEIDIKLHNRTMTISGSKTTVEENDDEYLHRGISYRNFERVFPLAEHIEVVNALVKNGILTISLERHVPEALKPKTIDIKYLT